ncbi:cationic amino acid transporter 8, vacuolar-like [Rhodamnia argentea]|uniref:Cationic amino acid transporter 8, vacuolar-like n=1 Tax=Rhodamnia argentea TaxID=178133 RepID=A0ABM3H3H7_9MYRT|nr:cationic amino acid transporter 8, vacuolar-like [Rhodamnia argentea]
MDAQDREHRSYWRWSKQDFFPEESFVNFASYRKALSQTCPRLRDRILDRSTQTKELVELKKESENDMKRCLNWWDLMWLCFGSVVGSGIFVITGQEAHDHAGPAIVLSYAISGLSALLSAFCYTEFAVEIPVAGGSFSFLRIELGDFIAFIAAGNILLEAIVGAAGLGRSWTSYFASMIKNDPDFLRLHVNGLAEGFNLLDPLAVVVLVVANSIAMAGTKQASCLNWISSVVSAGVIVLIIALGFSHGHVSNLVPFFPQGASGVFAAAAIVYWSYTGFDMVATMAEETKKPSRDIPIGLAGSMTVITVIYCLMALALTMMQKYTEIDRNAAYSVAFSRMGMKWAKYVISICALKGMTTSLLVGALGQARYMTQIARAHMIPPWFALVHPKTGTPINATLLITVLSAVVAFFSSLDVLSSVLSFSTLFIFMLMAIALLVRRYYVKGETPKSDLHKLLVYLFVIVASCIGGTAIWGSNSGGWIGYIVAVIFWFLGTLGMQLLPQRRAPQLWGIPLVPYLPSLSIGMNIFLIGSLGSEAFWRFFICTAVMILYYLFVGLHATYDVAHHIAQESKVEDGKENVDRGLS